MLSYLVVNKLSYFVVNKLSYFVGSKLRAELTTAFVPQSSLACYPQSSFLLTFIKLVSIQCQRDAWSSGPQLRILQQTCWYLSIQLIAPPPDTATLVAGCLFIKSSVARQPLHRTNKHCRSKNHNILGHLEIKNYTQVLVLNFLLKQVIRHSHEI